MLGPLLFSYGFLTYTAIILALVCTFILKRTRVGLQLTAVGESPATADAAGINVNRYKYVATISGAVIAGFGGLTKMSPYVVTIIILILTSKRNKPEEQPPASLGLSYFREER